MLRIGDYVFTGFFTMDVLLRIVVLGRKFWMEPLRHWQAVGRRARTNDRLNKPKPSTRSSTVNKPRSEPGHLISPRKQDAQAPALRSFLSIYF